MKRPAPTPTRLRDLRDRIARASLASPVTFPEPVAIEAAPRSARLLVEATGAAWDVVDGLGISPDDAPVTIESELDRETVTITSRTPAAYARLDGGLRAALDARVDGVLAGKRSSGVRHA